MAELNSSRIKEWFQNTGTQEERHLETIVNQLT